MSDVDAATLGGRIREARERAGLSQGRLAEQVHGLDRTAVNKVEAGVRQVSALELADIATILGVRMASFFHEPIPALIAHRMTQDRETVDAKIDRLIEDLATDVEFVYSLAPEEFGFPTTSEAVADTRFRPPDSMGDAESLSGKARALVGLDAHQPVHDLVTSVSTIGLMAFSVDLGLDAADAATILLRTGGVSVVNSHNLGGRRRISLAHELGHYLVRDQYTVDWRVAQYENADVEARLDRFARSFLLPAAGVRAAWRENVDKELRETAVILGSRFRVDMATLARRALELDLVDATEARLIRTVKTTKSDFIEFGLHMEPEMERTTMPRTYQKAILSLVRNERISRERALELLLGTFVEDDLPPVRPRRDDELWNFVS